MSWVNGETLHDLRRSFGTRWSRRLMPAQLCQLMRHTDMKVTMTYYVQERPEDMAGALYSTSEVTPEV